MDNQIEQFTAHTAEVEAYLKTLPISLNNEEVIKAEKDWAEIQISKQKILRWAKARLLTKEDYQDIRGKLFIKKSGVRRLMSAFNISITEVKLINTIERAWETAPADYVQQIGSKTEIIVIMQAKAQQRLKISKNEQTVDVVLQEMVATSAYSSREAYEKRQPYKYHNILATAETRAKSRAGLDMLSGDVSIEEITFDAGE